MSQDISSHQSDQPVPTVTQLQAQNAGIQLENERLKAELAALTLSVSGRQLHEKGTLTTGGVHSQNPTQHTDDEGYPSDRSLQDESPSATSTEGVIDLQASSSTSLSSDSSQASSPKNKTSNDTPTTSAVQPSTKPQVGSSSKGGDQASL